MKKKVKICCGMILMLAALILFSKNTYATNYYSVKSIKWDITGNGKKDTIRFEQVRCDEYYYVLNIYINGVKKFKTNRYYESGYSFKVFKLKNKQRYIFIASAYPFGGEGFLLHYKNKKLVCDADIKKTVGNANLYEYPPSFRKTKGNKVYINLGIHEVGPLFAVKSVIGFRYKKGKLRPISKTYKVISYGEDVSPSKLTPKKNLKIFKDKKCKKHLKTIKKGTAIRKKITKVFNGKKYVNYYIKGVGWFKGSNSYLFKEVGSDW